MRPEVRTNRACTSHLYCFTALARGVLSSALGLLIFAVPGTPMSAQDTGRVFDNERIGNSVQSLRTQLEKSKGVGSGLAEAQLDEVTLVAVRVKSGRAEIHMAADDIFFILSGEAILVTGGKIVNPSGTGEIRGDSITGGFSAKLEKGEVIYIPRAVPHQLLLPESGILTYMVIKIPR
jgi:mannose-6-phosphate isomerase-like protein (cupin superfamily)